MASTQHLPPPVTHVYDWQPRGACVGKDSAVFFHPDGERGALRRARAERAKRVCQQCPVIGQCREFSLATREPYGVWGGLTEEERSEIVRNQRQQQTAS